MAFSNSEWIVKVNTSVSAVCCIQYTLVSRTRLVEIPVNTYTVSIPFKYFKT